jgi:hypothetical protein
MTGRKIKAAWKRLLGVPPSASSEYQYQELVADKEIRLLLIQPAKDYGDPIRCKIRHVRLEAASEYICLSYTWGSSMRTTPIQVNGRNLKITANLEEFLRYIQVRNSVEVVFWIDAVCINQDNLTERASQVRLMKDIFAGAGLVLAWLGDSDATTESAFELAEELGGVFRDELADQGLTSNFPAVAAWVAAHTSPMLETCSWMALANVLNRPWWTRAWVVQEVILARSVVIVCGEYSLPWEYIYLAATAALSHMATMTTIVAAGYTNEQNPVEAQTMHSRFDLLVNGVRQVRAINATAVQRLNEGMSSSFYNILRRHATCEATDPLDRVYAYLGLADTSHNEVENLPIDYTLSAAELYRLVVRRHLEAGQGLRILNSCHEVDRSEGYSSWTSSLQMPRWIPAGDLLVLQNPPHIVYKAASELQAEFRFDGPTLYLKGVLFDKIEAIGEIADLRPGKTINGSDYTPLNVFKSWQLVAGFSLPVLGDDELDVEAVRSIGFYPAGNITRGEAWLRTILANPTADPETSYFGPETGIDMEQVWANQRVEPDGHNDEHLSARAGFSAIDRRFYVTSRGYFGLGPPATTVGDVVAVFYGGETPFLLRQRGSFYEIVAESYVQGLMSGELMSLIQDGTVQAEIIALQ